MITRRYALGSLIVLASSAHWIPAVAQRGEPGILGRPAPSWQVDDWIQLPQERKGLDVTDLKGKVVYLYCFQSWCPGCHKHGFPTLQALEKEFRDEEDVAFVSVQTVFEGFSTNTREKVAETAKRYGLKIPFGHSGSNGKRSPLMQNYRTGGTPWTVVIDRNGTVRFNDFHISKEQGGKLIRSLLDSK